MLMVPLLIMALSLSVSVDARRYPGFGGGGQAQVPEVPSPPSPFADIAARDTYYTANPDELRNDPRSVYTVVEITGGSTFRWSGEDEPSTYDANQWQLLAAENSPEMIKTLYESNANTNAFTDNDDTAVASIMNLDPGEIPMSDGSTLQESGMTVGVVNGLSRVTINGELAPRSGGGLRLGQNDIGGGGNIYGGGSALRYSNTVNDTESYPITSLVTTAGSGRAFYPKFAEQRNDPSPADKSETFTGNPGHRFAFNNPLPGRVTKYTINNPTTTTFTGCNFTIWENGYDDPNPLFDFVDSNPAPVKTFDIPPGDVEVTPPEPIGFPPTGTRIFSDIRCASGNVQLAGQTIDFPIDPTNPTGPTEEVEFPYIEFERNFSTQQFVEDDLGNPASDGQVLTSTAAGVRSWITPAAVADHPVTLRRDMPTEEDAQDLVDASLNNNSALWIVANDQNTDSNRADATLVAQRAGLLDLNGNEIPTTPVAANTIQMRSGTIVRIFAANDYRVVESPVFEGDIPQPLPPVEINAQEFTINTTNYTNYLDRTIRLTNTNTSVTQAIRFSSIADFLALNPGRDLSFSFIVNRGASNLRADFIPAGGNTIAGQANQMRFEGQTITITLPSSGTDWLVTSVTGNARASQVLADDAAFANIDESINTVQDGLDQLNRLFGIVAAASPGTNANRFSGPFVPFTDSVNIGPTNFDLYSGNTGLYARSDDARVNFILPTDAEITAQGVGASDPVEFTVLNQAGTARFDTGLTPTNTVVIDVEGANNIRRGSATGTLLNFIEAHQNDLVTLAQSARGQPWVATRVTLSSAALLLPNGLFHLQVGTTVSLNPTLGTIAGFPIGVTPTAGDAYVVRVGNDSFGGFGVEQGDVIVALQDNPSRLNNSTNDDWLVIRNATNDIISLSEIRFLNTIEEVDTTSEQRAILRTDISDIRIFLSPYVLDHAPFINPSTDPNNPQSGETQEYIGGDESVTTDALFSATQAQVNAFTGETGANLLSSALLYFDIDGTIQPADLTTFLSSAFLVVKDRDGNEVFRHNLEDDFRAVTLTGSTDTYYVFDTAGLADNYSGLNYALGQTIDIVQTNVNRGYNLTDDINVIPAIADGSIDIEKLEPTAQALLLTNHSLSYEQETKLNGLEVAGDPTPWTAGDLYVKDNDASSNNDLSHYVNVGQQNGILAHFEGTRSITFLVPKFVNVTNLVEVDDNTKTVSVTPIGIILDRQAFTAVLPQSSFDINNPAGTAYAVNGTASNEMLSGAAGSFKIDRENLDSNLDHAIFDEVPTSSLPEVLTALSNDLTRTTTTASGWRSLPSASQFGLVREAAKLWDENVRSATGNYFDDITGVEFVGFQNNNIFFYNTPDDSLNTAFPGFQSYILNSNVRIRNTAGKSDIGSGAYKIIMFDYSLQRPLTNTDNQSMVRVGPSSSTPLMALSGQEGLFLNIGREDGSSRTRTYASQLEVDGRQWHTPVGTSTAVEAEVIIPDDLTGSLTLTVAIHLDNNGTDSGTHSETITISNLAADQTIGNRNYSYTVAGSPVVRTISFTYDAVNNDLPNARRVLFVRPTTALANAAFTWNVEATRSITETWTASTTYARYPVNSGDPHDRFGLFDPSLYNTERVRVPEHVAIMLRPYRLGDQSADPEMAAYVVVDGEHEGESSNGRLIRLHRPLSDFATNDVSIGNSIVGVSHLQMYRYAEDQVPTEAEFYRLTTNEDSWLGAFTDADEETDTFKLNGNLELGTGDVFIMTDTDTGTRRSIEINNGSIMIKSL